MPGLEWGKNAYVMVNPNFLKNVITIDVPVRSVLDKYEKKLQYTEEFMLIPSLHRILFLYISCLLLAVKPDIWQKVLSWNAYRLLRGV